MYLLLHMDDIVLTTSSLAPLHRTITALQREFAMKDLGQLHHFLGIVIKQRFDGLFLQQHHYTMDILDHVGMTSCKPCSIPVDTQAKLSSADGGPVDVPTAF